jgi:hypothetical protein
MISYREILVRNFLLQQKPPKNQHEKYNTKYQDLLSKQYLLISQIHVRNLGRLCCNNYFTILYLQVTYSLVSCARLAPETVSHETFSTESV